MMRPVLATLLLAGACVKGNPDLPPAVFHGGSITPPGCPYTVTTRDGAEAPMVAPNIVDSDPTPKQVRLGLAGDPKSSIVIQWRDNDEMTKASTVRWGVGSALDQTTTGLTFGFESNVSGTGDIIQMHEAHLCGLTPDTQYSYQVGATDAGGVDHFSPTYTFRTAPDPVASPDAEVVIGVIGDSRGGYDVQAQLLQQIAGKMPDVLFFSGDAVTLGPVQPEWEDFFDALEPLVQSVPIVSAHGNHEVMAINYFAQFAMPGDEENYGLDYGPLHLTVLNDSPTDSTDIQGKVAQFLQSDLTAHDSAPWKFVMHHRPAYSSATAHGSDPMLQATFGPIFDQHHVDLVLNGHDHDYERSKPLKAGAVQADASMGTVYIVNGGLGAELYDNGTNFFTAVSQKTHSAMVIHLRGKQLTLDAFDPTGAPVDSYTITKP